MSFCVSLSLNRGASIARLTQKDMSECFPILASMEALGAELACARATDAEVAAIRALHDDMIEQYERRDLKSYIETNLAIHDAMQEAARNPTHLAIYQSLAARMRPARLMANVTDERWAEAIEEHKAMQAALETRDGPALAAILRKHIGHIHQRVSRVTPPDV
jgi:DNA-binding GntR family transcriptional regulator